MRWIQLDLQQRSNRYGAQGACPSVAPVLLRVKDTFLVALLLVLFAQFAPSRAVAASPAPDPTPQPQAASGSSAAPTPDPAPQASSGTAPPAESQPKPAAPTTPSVAPAPSGGSQVTTSAPTATHTSQPAVESHPRRLRPHHHQPVIRHQTQHRRVMRNQAQARERELRSLFASAAAAPITGDHRGGVLLLLSAVAMAVLVLASLRLLRVLMRVNATSYGGPT